MNVVVRPAVPTDAAAIHRLNVAYNDERATPSYIAEAIVAHAQFERLFVAEVDGEVVGMVGLRLLPSVCDPEPYAELTELFVAEEARRHGVGRALVRAVEEAARAGGAGRLVLFTAWRNGRAHRFYHALGFQLYTLTMVRELVPPDRKNVPSTSPTSNHEPPADEYHPGVGPTLTEFDGRALERQI